MSVKCECGVEHENWIPKDRLDRVTEQRRDAVRQISELEGTITELETKLGDATKAGGQVETYQARVTELEGRIAEHGTREAILLSGVTDAEGLDVVSVLYGRLAEKDRPEGGIGAWLQGDTLPKAVRAYMPEVKAEGAVTTTTTDTTTTGGTTLPKSNTGATGTTTTAGPYSPEAVAKMSPAQYREHRTAILASLSEVDR